MGCLESKENVFIANSDFAIRRMTIASKAAVPGLLASLSGVDRSIISPITNKLLGFTIYDVKSDIHEKRNVIGLWYENTLFVYKSNEELPYKCLLHSILDVVEKVQKTLPYTVIKKIFEDIA